MFNFQKIAEEAFYNELQKIAEAKESLLVLARDAVLNKAKKTTGPLSEKLTERGREFHKKYSDQYMTNLRNKYRAS